MLIVIIAAVVLLAGIIFMVMKMRMGKPPRAKTGISGTSATAVSSTAGVDLSQIQTLDAPKKASNFKPIPFADITFADELGNGAFGVVYKCTFQATKCAIKKLHSKEEKSERLIKELVTEFDVMSALRHPNVLLTLGIAEDAATGSKGIVMELMEASLADVLNLKSFEQFSSWEGAFYSIASDVSNGMAYIHFNNMLHRDLKPGNVLLDAQWVAKIADFGTVFDPTASTSNEGDIQGTPPYMAPEIVQKNVYDKPVDVWAFGCVLAHMGSKRPPYAWLQYIETPKQLIDVVRNAEHSPLELLLESKETPESMKQLAKMCCHPSPTSRPDFETISKKITAAIPEGADPRPVARIKNKRPLKTSMALVGDSAPERTSESRPSSLDQSYRDKFKNRSKSGAFEQSYRANADDAPSSSSSSAPPPAAMEEKPSLFSTFSDTLLATFTPGKEAAKDEKS